MRTLALVPRDASFMTRGVAAGAERNLCYSREFRLALLRVFPEMFVEEGVELALFAIADDAVELLPALE